MCPRTFKTLARGKNFIILMDFGKIWKQNRTKQKQKQKTLRNWKRLRSEVREHNKGTTPKSLVRTSSRFTYKLFAHSTSKDVIFCFDQVFRCCNVVDDIHVFFFATVMYSDCNWLDMNVLLPPMWTTRRNLPIQSFIHSFIQ